MTLEKLYKTITNPEDKMRVGQAIGIVVEAIVPKRHLHRLQLSDGSHVDFYAFVNVDAELVKS